MASKKIILKTGTYNYHGWPWDIFLVRKLPLHHSHHIFYRLVVTLTYYPPFDMML